MIKVVSKKLISDPHLANYKFIVQHAKANVENFLMDMTSLKDKLILMGK